MGTSWRVLAASKSRLWRQTRELSTLVSNWGEPSTMYTVILVPLGSHP
eukprot:jgi/Botrbrau1/22316/Bobra.0585s0001.1